MTDLIRWFTIWSLPLTLAGGNAALGQATAPVQTTQPVQDAAPASPPAETRSNKGTLPYGTAGLPIPPAEQQNATSPRTVQLLADAMAGQDPQRRAQLIYEIGLCGLPQGAAPIRAALNDPEPLVRTQACLAASVLGDPALAGDVARLLDDASAEVRKEALLATVRLTADAASAARSIEKGMADADPAVVRAAIRVARDRTTAQPVVAKLDALSPALKAEAMRMLARLGDADFAPAAAGLLDQDVATKSAALQALGAMRSSAHLPQVRQLLSDPHPTVRRSAADALATLAPVEIIQQQGLALLKDADPTVRQSAARLLGAAPMVEMVSPLVAQLADPYRPLAQAAREALCSAEPPQVKQACIRAAEALLRDADPRRREDGSYILGRFGSNASIAEHIALLELAGNAEKTDWLLVRQAAESLARIGDRSAAPAIARVVALAPMGPAYDPAKTTGYPLNAIEQAIIASGMLGDRTQLEKMRRIMSGNPEEQPANLRAAAVWTYGMLETSNDDAVVGRLMRVYTSTLEADETRYEAIKAIGNLDCKSAEQALLDVYQQEFSPPTRWVAHWAYERVSGKRLPFSPAINRRYADVSIVDLPPG